MGMPCKNPRVCNGNPETSVLAHIRLTGLCGTGTKPPDLIATIACSACHDEIDRRTHFVDAGYAKECALEGMARTQVIWLKEGLLRREYLQHHITTASEQ